ncbi:hypothetical protein QX233_14575 [Chryseobacterium gambrini]|uniref:Uncharacterized protein n=1 Tax=Chryseobacterium gambrini TaxID=373672 RepID=A0AAJ1VJZ8_9FLAO|nr:MULTISPECIES: hypothetical protein [Chryseobacterium]MDN4013700.1 hypothetical protein [Chryseobacterium gambrini]MDN4028065.1 hypothetical protein [Chryseobacterium gambrini]QWA39781.1 hypothetical protein KKI44_06120 [Chryseobacterium sp. ZHDP1]
MNYTFFFDDDIFDSLIKAKEQKKIKYFDIRTKPSLKVVLEDLNRLDIIHKGIKRFYEKRGDGFELEWWANEKKGIGGKIQFAQTKYLFSEDNNLYDEEDEEDLKYFRPLDYPTPESYVGFIITPDTIDESLYYMSISDYELNDLDLDYEGYTQMAVEARVFNHWQLVLLYYMDGEGIGLVETETFKTEMPKIFPDWTWENFIAKFESLRLSNKNK